MNDGEDEEMSDVQVCCQLTTDCFIFSWFICGNVWVYKNYMPSFQPGSADYCDRTLYLFSFWLITSLYIALGACFCCLCCFACVDVCFCDNDDD